MSHYYRNIPAMVSYSLVSLLYMSCVMRKPGCFSHYAKKTQISALVFATKIVCVQSLYFLNPKVQAANHLMLLYSPVCVGPGRKP